MQVLFFIFLALLENHISHCSKPRRRLPPSLSGVCQMSQLNLCAGHPACSEPVPGLLISRFCFESTSAPSTNLFLPHIYRA
jgi:hypothetical protein